MRARTRYLAGHTGLVGSALRKRWATDTDAETLVATRTELDLTLANPPEIVDLDAPDPHLWSSRTNR